MLGLAKPANKFRKMTSGKAKSVDKMSMKEVFKTMEALGLSDDGLESLSEMKSRLRDALNQAEKTSNWSPRKVRYFRTNEF